MFTVEKHNAVQCRKQEQKIMAEESMGKKNKDQFNAKNVPMKAEVEIAKR